EEHPARQGAGGGEKQVKGVAVVLAEVGKVAQRLDVQHLVEDEFDGAVVQQGVGAARGHGSLKGGRASLVGGECYAAWNELRKRDRCSVTKPGLSMGERCPALGMRTNCAPEMAAARA